MAEEKEFYTWDEIEKDLSELELQYGDSDEIVKNLITPSVSSYWKKKLDEEKILHEKIIETKEEEKKQLILKNQQLTQIIEELKKHIEKLEQGEFIKLAQQKEDLKLKELELVKEKEKLIWQQQIQGLEFDKKIIEQEIDRAKKEFDREKQELLIYYNRQFNSLLEVQKDLIEETNKLEKELELIVATAKEEVKNEKNKTESVIKDLEETKKCIEKLKQEKQIIENEKILLQGNIEKLKEQNKIDKKQLIDSVSQIIKTYVTEVRSLTGVIIGAINFCDKFSGSKKSVKFHYELILTTIQRVLSILDELTKSISELQF